MAGNTLINGTGYKIVGGGRVLVNGVSYQVQKGRTLIGGTGYDIAFQKTVGHMPIGTIINIKARGTTAIYKGVIVHKGNPDPSMYDASCNGVWIWLKYCLISPSSGGRDDYTYPFDRYNREFNDSDAFYCCNTILYNMLKNATPSFASLIKTVKIPYADKSQGKVLTLSQGVSAVVFPLSLIELGYSPDDDIPKDGAKLSYFNTDADRISMDTTSYQNRGQYVTRTVSMSNVALSYRVNGYGQKFIQEKYYAASFSPAFIMPYDTKLNDDNYIIT